MWLIKQMHDTGRTYKQASPHFTPSFLGTIIKGFARNRKLRMIGTNADEMQDDVADVGHRVKEIER